MVQVSTHVYILILLFYATLNRGIGDIPNSIAMLVALLQ